MKPVGIIILNWNGAALLRRYLPSVVAANSNDIADVVVVDNGSTDAISLSPYLPLGNISKSPKFSFIINSFRYFKIRNRTSLRLKCEISIFI